MQFSTTTLAVSALCVMAFGYALLSVAIRLMSTGAEPLTQAYIRIGLAAILATVIFYKELNFKKFRAISQKDWLLLTIMGTAGYGLSVIFITLGALNTKLLNVAVVSATVPFFVFLYALFFLREHVNKILFLFLIISFWGVCMVATKSFFPVLSQFGIGEFYVLLFAAGAGTYSICRKKLSTLLNNKEITVIVMIIAFISSFLPALFMGESFVINNFLNPLFLLGLAIGVGFNIVATQFGNFAFAHLNPIHASQLLLLESVFAPIFGFFLYKEIILPIELLGALLIIFSVIVSTRFAKE